MTEKEQCWENLYREYQPKVMAYIKARLPQQEDAEDLCADIFLKLLQRFPEYDKARASLSTWIYTITHNAVVDYYRTHRPSAEIPENFRAEDDLEGAGLRRETLDELAAALRGLPEEQRTIIVLHYYHGLTLMEIASRMRLTYGIVKLRHKDALRRLSLQIGDAR